MTPQLGLDEPQNIPQKRSYRFLFFLIAAIVAAALLLFLWFPVSPAVSVFCGKTCHSMNPTYQSWVRSSHSGTACLDCHSDGSRTDRIAKICDFSIRHIRKEMTGRYQPIKVADHRQVPEKTCVRCHKPKNRSKSKGRIIDHLAHSKLGLSCKSCHNRAAHEGAQKYPPIDRAKKRLRYKDYASMRDGCWRCHRDGGKFVDSNDRIIIGPYKKGKAVASTDCNICHNQFDIAQLKKNVQKIWLRHAELPRWRKGVVHGQMARSVDFKPCQVCHNPDKRCAVCHKGITMPHDANWIDPSRHGAVAKATKIEPCRMCHNLKEVPACSANGHHHEEFTVKYKFDLKKAAWKSGKERHGVVAKDTGGRRCFQCHEQSTWCTTQCHNGVTMPHRPEWRRVHFLTVGYNPGMRAATGKLNWDPSQAAICQMCHNPGGLDKDWCQRCHHKQFYEADPQMRTPWFEGGMIQAGAAAGISLGLEGNVNVCVANCHPGRLAFCLKCHERFSD